MTFIATSWAISYCGATPVFVDVDPATYTMDPNQVDDRITPRTKAILPVHLYGQPADLGPLLEIADRHGIPLIEDAAQAHWRRYRGKPVGGVRAAGCFSFYPGKNLGACGEGGAVVTDDDAIAARLRALRDHAQTQRYHHDEIGFNYRMDALQGAVLGDQAEAPGAAGPSARRRLAERYLELLARPAARLCRRAPRTGATSGTCSSSCTRSATASAQRAGSAGHPDRPALPDPAAPAEGLRAPGLQAGRLPGVRADRPRVLHAAAVPGDDRRAAGRGRRGA